MTTKMKTTALAPWMGSNRMNASAPGELLGACEWIGVCFAGGMCEVPHMKARTILVNDRHRHIINLAGVVAQQAGKTWITGRLDNAPFHPDTLLSCQIRCKERERDEDWNPDLDECLRWALDYFVCSWMARNGTAGTAEEFDQSISLRYTAGGGDSNVRFRSATESLHAWSEVMRRCTFTTDDVFDMLAKCHDKKGHGLYLDPPWPDDGDGYKHGFMELVNWRNDMNDKVAHVECITKHEALARTLSKFEHTRIVVRYGDCQLIRDLYPESIWERHVFAGRTQANKAKREVLLVNRSSRRKTSGSEQETLTSPDGPCTTAF